MASPVKDKKIPPIIMIALIVGLFLFINYSTTGRSACTSEWSCSNWGPCIDGTQDRNCGDINNCENATSQPILEQECQLCQPSLEICDGVDNDCDGFVDEDLINYETCYSSGLCAGSYRLCEEGAWTECTVLPSQETCNGLDDNCDGSTDESLERTCIINTNPGVETCTSGAWVNCVPTTISTFSCSEFQCIPDVNGIFAPISSCEESCICEPHWSCGGWSAWSNIPDNCGQRARSCVDDNNCPDEEFEGILIEYKECITSECGNSILEPGEFCDGIMLNGNTCQSLGYDTGSLFCNPQCSEYDISDCKESVSVQGDLPDLKYFTCTDIFQCVEDEQGKYLTSECGGQCVEQKGAEIEEKESLFTDSQLVYVMVFALALLIIYNSNKGKK